MKKIFLFAAVAAVALNSCSKNEVYVNPADAANAIGFGTYVGSATKATVEDKFTDGDVFVIDAYYTAKGDMKDAADENATLDEFMQDQTVTAKASSAEVDSWSYSPIKYWPNNDGDKVSFFAVTDATGTKYGFDALADNTTTPSFTVDNANTDIMIASALNKTKNAEAVAFKFQHTMAQVKFTAKTTNTFDDDLDNTTIKITSLSVNYGETKQGGTFTFDNAAENTGTWAAAEDGSVRAEDKFESGAGIATALTTSPAELGTPLMILPIEDETYTVTVVYDVETKVNGDAGDADANDSKITNTCTFEIEPETMNTIYTYNLAIGLTAVKVSGDITGTWGSESATVTIVDSKTETVPLDQKNKE